MIWDCTLIKGGFSLIELMVVIAIVGILSVMAVPAYNTHMLKAKISEKITLLNSLKKDIIIAYQVNGTFPESIRFGNTTLLNQNVHFNSNQSVGIGNIEYVLYNGGINQGYPMARLLAKISGLEGIPGYSPPQEDNEIANNQLRMIFYEDNGTIKTICGPGSPSYTIPGSADIPLEYLPEGCNCEYVEDIYQGTVPVDTCG